MMEKYKLIAFDMDGTLLNGRTIFVFAEKKGFKDVLLEIIDSNICSYKKTVKIAKLLEGSETNELLKFFRNIPLQKHVELVIKEIKKKKIKIAIITNSYSFVANDLGKRLGVDYVFANDLIVNNGVVTGKIVINNCDLSKRFSECKIHSICKGYLLEKLCRDIGIQLNESIAIGDNDIDICMIEKAGLGIAFNASDEVNKHADIYSNDLRIILNYI